MKRNEVPYKPIKAALHRAGITYAEVAARHGCIYRFVQFVIDNKRTSQPLLDTIQAMILERRPPRRKTA